MPLPTTGTRVWLCGIAGMPPLMVRMGLAVARRSARSTIPPVCALLRTRVLSVPAACLRCTAFGNLWRCGLRPSSAVSFCCNCWRISACLHLHCRKRLRAPRTNRIIRSSRSLFRGAPLVLALAMALPSAWAMLPRARLVYWDLDSDSSDHSAVVRSAASLDSTLRCDAGAHDVPVPAAAPSEDGPQCASPPPLAYHYTVLVLRPQRPPRRAVISARSRQYTADFVRDVEAAIDIDDRFAAALPVHPQPHSDCPVVALVGRGPDESPQTTVCLQLHVGHPTVYFWLASVHLPVTLEQVRTMLGPDWLPGSKALVGESPSPLKDTCRRDLASGTLFVSSIRAVGSFQCASLPTSFVTQMFTAASLRWTGLRFGSP